MDVDGLRDAFPAARAAAYLNTGTFGPLPERTRQAMVEHLDERTRDGRIGSRGFARWMELVGGAREALAGVVHATPEDIAVTHSTTDGVNVVIGGMDWRAGDVVVTTTAEHPGLTEPLHWAAQRHGVVVREIDVDASDDPVAAIAGALDDRTRLVALSHVLWTDGRVLDLAGIAEAAHAAGALVLADGAQGPGCVPIDCPALGADFYTISGQKWLCGPSGTGGLYVRPDRLDAIAPAWPNYMTRDHRSEGDPLWPAARRFDVGTITLGALAGLLASVAVRTEFDIEAGAARALELAGGLRGQLHDVPGVEPIDVDRPSSLVAFRVEGDPDEVSKALEERGVLARSVPGRPWVRASVGPWNDEGDLDRLVEGLRAVTS
jgi:L-cysteine/cystine lyase